MNIQITLPPYRCSVEEAGTLLRISRAQMYRKIASGQIRAHKDARRQYITSEEIRRYLQSLEAPAAEVTS
jgi:excisionase family DNA binding protein